MSDEKFDSARVAAWCFVLIAIIIAVLLMFGCAGGRGGIAIPDLGRFGLDTCRIYTDRGQGLAETAWESDWPVFAPLMHTEPDASADEEFCRDVIESRGAVIATKPDGHEHSTALAYAVFLAPDFEQKSKPRRASTMCHEAAHIVWQHRVGVPMAIIEYATISGRMTAEATAYAISDLIMRRYGASDADVEKDRRRRADVFPKLYRLGRLVSSECVYDYLSAVSDALRDRTSMTPVDDE